MIILGLTGGIASGKSAVARILRRQYRASTLDIDDITHQLLLPGNVLFNLYQRHFGTADRKIIADIIFNNPKERHWINDAAHPILLNYARDFLCQCQECGVRLAVIEVPLLFEAHWEHLFDQIWVVFIHHQLQLQRLIARDKLSLEQANARLKSQLHPNVLKRRADLTLRNDKSYKILRRKIHSALQIFF